jgi:hypothetical protein
MPKRTINKSAFVREMGDLPAAEIVQKAKQRGFSLSIAHIHTIRSAAKRAHGGASAKVASPRKATRSNGGGTGLHAAIDRLAARFVTDLLSAVRGASLDDVLGT